MKNNSPTVRTKLAVGFGSLALAVLVIAAFALHALSSANEGFISYLGGVGARAALANEVRTAVDRRAIAARNMVLVTTASDLADENVAVLQAHADVQNRLARLEDMVQHGASTSPRAQALVAEMRRIESLYGPVALGIVQLAKEGRKEEAAAKISSECRPLLAQLVAAADAYRTYTEGHAREIVAEHERLFATQRAILVAICLAAFVAALAAAMMISRSLTRALGAEPAQLGLAAQRIASGDLQRIEGAETASPGSVLASLGQMQHSLAGIVGEVRGASDSIAHGSAEIAAGNADLSQRTEEQASALQQTASTMGELDKTVRHNADNARQASGLAASAALVAARGGEIVDQVVSTMRDIADGSSRIADIIGHIDAVAFQTNILALNAAVEAARAGEQGRGFAVVASEVRALAQRSASAAREIKALIGSSASRVEKGTVLVDHAGKTMSEIVQSIRQVSDIVDQISAASTEQSAGVSQVGDAVSQMDKVTQQNAALVEESAAAAASLRHQAQQLVAAVGAFRLDEALGLLGGAQRRHLSLPALPR